MKGYGGSQVNVKSLFSIETHGANSQRCSGIGLGKYPPRCAAASRQSRKVLPPGFNIVFLQLAGYFKPPNAP
jgi:hypothetical protein